MIAVEQDGNRILLQRRGDCGNDRRRTVAIADVILDDQGNIMTLDRKRILIPEINKIKKQNINIQGPISADAMLTTKNIKKYDCFLFVFHDQALIPFKYISKFSGVNYTANLNIIRTSPDHGVAYDLVGKNKAIPRSLINCFNLISKINKNRNKFIKS